MITKAQRPTPKRRGNREVEDVVTSAKPSHLEAQLHICVENKAVIKMIIKGRSPTMRHVSRTHRVALDWLFDRIDLDPKIQMKYIDTKIQFVDMLSKGNSTQDEWDHLLWRIPDP